MLECETQQHSQWLIHPPSWGSTTSDKGRSPLHSCLCNNCCFGQRARMKLQRPTGPCPACSAFLGISSTNFGLWKTLCMPKYAFATDYTCTPTCILYLGVVAELCTNPCSPLLLWHRSSNVMRGACACLRLRCWSIVWAKQA